MKKIFNGLKGLILFALININYAKAQDVASNTSNSSNLNNSLAPQVTNKAFTPNTAAKVNKKAIAAFEKMYKIQPVWDIMESGGYTASFAEADIQHCVYYDKKGNWTCNIKRYDESKMSSALRKMIKPVYYDYKINGISEITVPGDIVHLVYLEEDATNFKTVRVCNGEMEVIQWIRNGKFVNQ